MITLSNSITVCLMLEITKILSQHNDMTLSHFYTEQGQDEGDGVFLYAYYPGNAHYVGRSIPVNSYRTEHAQHAEAFAKDLNTLFGLV